MESNFLKSIEGHTKGPFVVCEDDIETRLEIRSAMSRTKESRFISCTHFVSKQDEADANLLSKSYLLPDIYKLLEEAVTHGQFRKEKATELLDKLNS